MYGWDRIEGLTPAGKRAALEIGTAVHEGLAHFHGGAGKVTVEQALETAKKKLKDRGGMRSTFDDKTVDEAIEIVEAVLPAYFDHWQEKEQIWKPLNQEIQFTVEVGDGTDAFLRGKADNLHTAKGGLYLVDYKTAGRMDPRDLKKYELDVQLSAYIYGLTKFLTEQSLAKGGDPVLIRGAIVDLLVKTKVPQFARELFTRTIEELFEFEQEWVETCDEIREKEDRVAAGEPWKVVFTKNTDNCFRYGTCPYHELCLHDSPVRRALYEKRTPNYVDEARAELEAEWKKQGSPNA
jgi:hypothetical protein